MKLCPASVWLARPLAAGFCLFLAVCARAEEEPLRVPERLDVPGRRVNLSVGTLFIPDFYRLPPDGRVHVLVFFHGAAWMSEQNFYSARKNGVLVSVSLKPYQQAVDREERFQKLVQETLAETGRHARTDDARLGKLALASFSGGYSAVRDVLAEEVWLERVTDVVLADSLYCRVTDQQGEHPRVDEEYLKPFVRFARQAAAGLKTMWYTHLYPPEEKHRNNTTTLTATYLIRHVRAAREPAYTINPMGMRLAYTADEGAFHVRGYSGMTTQDHFNHFYNMTEYIRKTSLPDCAP